MAKFNASVFASRTNHETQDQVVLHVLTADNTTIFNVEERIHEGHRFSVGRTELHTDGEDALELFMSLGDELECDSFIELMAYDENGHLKDTTATADHNKVLTFGR